MMNIQDKIQEMLHRQAVEVENILIEAITNEIGEGWCLNDLIGRIESKSVQGSNCSTYFFDGKPIVEIHRCDPADMVNHSMEIKTSYRILNGKINN